MKEFCTLLLLLVVADALALTVDTYSYPEVCGYAIGRVGVNVFGGVPPYTKSVNRVTDWGNLDLNYIVKAHVNEEHCVRCNLCYVACEDGAHQSFEFVESNGHRYPRVIEEECVGCNLCALVCPSPGAITMERRDDGSNPQTWRERTAGMICNDRFMPLSGKKRK